MKNGLERVVMQASARPQGWVLRVSGAGGRSEDARVERAAGAFWRGACAEEVDDKDEGGGEDDDGQRDEKHLIKEIRRSFSLPGGGGRRGGGGRWCR